MLTVVTTCDLSGLKLYGHRFLSTFIAYWPRDVRLIVFTDGWQGNQQVKEWYDLELASPWYTEFKRRHRDNPEAHGRHRRKHGYRWDAVKFGHKVAAVVAADLMTTTDHLLWIDADTVTHSPVRALDITSWYPDPGWLSWLERDPRIVNYPECGFLLFNRAHPQHREAMIKLQDYYESDRIFALAETHDSWVWQQLVRALKLPTTSLSGPGYKSSHPLIHSPLGAWLDHCKGDRRKTMGRTDRRELQFSRTEPYWRP